MNSYNKRFRMRLVRFGMLFGMIVFVMGISGCASSQDFGQLDTPDKWRASLQELTDMVEADSMATSPTLHQVVRLSLRRNPGVQAMREKWLAAIMREPQATSLPDPMLQAGYQFESVETRVGPQRWNLGLVQSLPWWQKLWARGRSSAVMADIVRLQYESASRDLIIEAKDAYYELYYIDQAIAITEEIQRLVQSEAVLAYAELNEGRTTLAEAFRAESQAAQLGYDMLLLADQRETQATRMRAILHLPPDAKIGAIRTAPVYIVASDIDTLQKRAETWSEVLKIEALNIERAEYERFLAQLSRIPDIGVGFNTISTSKGGADPFIGLISMNLPIWEQRNRALIKEKETLEKAMKLQAVEKANRVRAAVAQAFFRVRLTKRLVDLYAQTLLPQAEAVMSQSEVLFRNEQASFSGVTETTMAYHNFMLAHNRALADHGQAIGRLEKVLGTTAEPSQGNEMENSHE